MATLQELLDNYGKSTGCNNWEGWVRECVQHPDMIVDKFNETISAFNNECKHQMNIALAQLKEKTYKNNWPNNENEYRNLLEKIKI